MGAPRRQPDEPSLQRVSFRVLIQDKRRFEAACRYMVTDISMVCRTALEELCESGPTSDALPRSPWNPGGSEWDQVEVRLTSDELHRFSRVLSEHSLTVRSVCIPALIAIAVQAEELMALDEVF